MAQPKKAAEAPPEIEAGKMSFFLDHLYLHSALRHTEVEIIRGSRGREGLIHVRIRQRGYGEIQRYVTLSQLADLLAAALDSIPVSP